MDALIRLGTTLRSNSLPLKKVYRNAQHDWVDFIDHRSGDWEWNAAKRGDVNCVMPKLVKLRDFIQVWLDEWMKKPTIETSVLTFLPCCLCLAGIQTRFAVTVGHPDNIQLLTKAKLFDWYASRLVE
ncbi:hypothetical protein DACRYDRAFT_115963 [Dacryopinax primogenitus]|uniref:Uncharacterized protein n=1 Tax=Dacryopinax primogenitus (strain DJM 731) TaxID=1858805 RepID=M5GDB1_DACPD|nr:uncharacterized protein DACRYDRAFT_115963 [Dacryopinax primogenitus]EJU02218.1 hypothetical protein DACRYDRAFT_115963 [Dacryopinax primogenitus]